MSVTGPAQVIRLNVMIGHRADRRRPGNEPVLIVMTAVIVEIREETELASVTFPDQILSKHIGYVDLLLAPAELVQVGVGVFLQHVESGNVVLPAIVVVIPENSDAQIRIVKNESAEIAHERLDAGPRRNEIVVIGEVANMDFGKRFLQ